MMYYVIDVYLRDRIKLVYKVIHQFKLNRNLRDSIGESFADDPLSEMESQVKDWVTDKSREIEDLKKLEQFRKEFLANLSHELKTPIFNIQGYVHTLLDGAMDDDPEVMKHFLERTAKSIDRLNNLVDDLDEISKIERGEVAMVKEIFDMTQLVKEVFESMELKAKGRSVSLNAIRGFDKPFFVQADKEKIRQVITNLVDNSIKYGKEQGETSASFYDMDENILVEITDNGIGIAEEHLPRLFERFYRIDKHRSREQGGTGLGLAIVKHILEAHDQTINVRSSVGVGTTFAFTLLKAKEK
jgi:two-component system phosphate regulon sensor histidine kinase PhoR